MTTQEIIGDVIGRWHGCGITLLSPQTVEGNYRVIVGAPTSSETWNAPLLRQRWPHLDRRAPFGSVGFIEFSIEPLTYDSRLDDYLLSIYVGVEPQYRGRGLVAPLHRHLERLAREFEKIGVACLEPMEGTESTLERIGYESITDRYGKNWMVKETK